MIHATNPERLLFFKAPCGDNPEQTAGAICASNTKHLLVFRAPRRDKLEHNALNALNPEHLLILGVHDLFHYQPVENHDESCFCCCFA